MDNYEWLCRKFKEAYHDDEDATPNIVVAGIVRLSKGVRTTQFIMTLKDKSDTIFDLDKAITEYRKSMKDYTVLYTLKGKQEHMTVKALHPDEAGQRVYDTVPYSEVIFIHPSSSLEETLGVYLRSNPASRWLWQL